MVVAEGEITGGEQPPGTIGGESTAALLREARDDDDVKAVVLRVDSPGGEVFASEQIRREVAALKAAGKPVVVSMGDLAASGGYWISMNADRIYADPSTITGSIGIFGLIPTIPRTLEKIGVHTDGVGTTPLRRRVRHHPAAGSGGGRGDPVGDRQGLRDFTGKVAQARDRSVDQIDAVARGRVWSGAQAQGARPGRRARRPARPRSPMPPRAPSWARRATTACATSRRPPRRSSGSSPGSPSSRIGGAWLRESDFAHGLLARFAPQMADDLRFLEGALQPVPGKPVKALAYCFCGL